MFVLIWKYSKNTDGKKYSWFNYKKLSGIILLLTKKQLNNHIRPVGGSKVTIND